MKLGDRLRELRQARKGTLLDVAGGTGISVSYLSDLERGRTKPSVDTLEKLAAYYGIGMTDLVADVEGWGSRSLDALAPGLAVLVEKQQIDEETAFELNRIQLRGKRPQSPDDWYELYLHLRRIVQPHLPRD